MASVKEEDTICYKVSRCQNALEDLVKTGSMDVLEVLKDLEKIRKDATRMEQSIRTNKALRLKHGIDAEYRKMMNEEENPAGVTQHVPEVRENVKEKPNYHIRMYDTKKKEVIYEGDSHAFVFVVVHKIKDIDLAGMIDGEAQIFAVGHDLALWYAFDQWQQRMRSKMVEIQMTFANSIRKNKFGDKAWKKQMLGYVNK